MTKLFVALLAFVLAGGITALELVTSKYPRTFFAVVRSKALYLYSIIYGVIAMGVTLVLDQLIENGTVQLGGMLQSHWAQAVVVGLTVKAFLHIRLATVTVGTQSFPLGVETIVQLFEPWLLRTVDINEFNGVQTFLEGRAACYSDLANVRERISNGVPQTFPDRSTLLSDVAQAPTVLAAMELYLRFMGRESFNRIFPPCDDLNPTK